MPWKYLNFFLDDDAKLQTIGREYGAGRMFTGEVKKELIQASVRICQVVDVGCDSRWTSWNALQ